MLYPAQKKSPPVWEGLILLVVPPGLARNARGPEVPTTANRKPCFAIANHFFHFLLKARAGPAYFPEMKNPRCGRGFST